MPKVDATCNLEVAAAYADFLVGGIFGIVVIVHKEESVAPFVAIEAFKGGGEVSAIFTEIVESLQICLSHCTLCNEQGGSRNRSQEYLFHLV